MAKKEQNIMLLQEVVGQLRKLNASSVRDRLREAEEAKRAEKIALQGDVQEEQQSAIVDSGEDFRRRFIAGQAKTFTDRTTGETGTRDRKRNELLIDVNKNIMEGFHYNTQAILGSEDIGGGSSFAGLIKVNTDSLVQNLSKIKNINMQMLDFMKVSRKEDDLRYDTAERNREEARREAIKLNSSLMSGTGAGAAGAGAGAGEMPIPDGSSGGGVGTAASAAAGVASLGLVARMKKWFGFGTKRGFAKTMALRFKILGRKIFRKFKLSGKQVKMLANPRKWPLVLAGVLAASFLSLSAKGDEGEDTSDDTVLPEDIPDLKEQSAFENGMDNMFTGLFAASILSKSTIVKNVAKTVGDKVRSNFKAAQPNTMKARLYKNPTFQRGLSLGGRGLLRFLGPWGLGAWVAWELGSMIMNNYSENLEAAEEARVAAIDAYTTQSVNLLDTEYDSLSNIVAPDNRISGKFDSDERKKEAIRTIKKLMQGKSQQEKDELINQLKFLGWNESELRSALNTPGGNGGTNLQTKLEMQENNRLGLLGPAGMGGGIINSGNSVVGDSITQISNYFQGNPGGGSAFEGRKGYMPGQ